MTSCNYGGGIINLRDRNEGGQICVTSFINDPFSLLIIVELFIIMSLVAFVIAEMFYFLMFTKNCPGIYKNII